MQIDGCVAMVTGAGSRIGAALAESFAAAGAGVPVPTDRTLAAVASDFAKQ
jgi:NAD(P)-dependent dehydrogenase (short-subunit alcohol dehydrogenase family)